jgi:hypothetical protein
MKTRSSISSRATKHESRSGESFNVDAVQHYENRGHRCNRLCAAATRGDARRTGTAQKQSRYPGGGRKGLGSKAEITPCGSSCGESAKGRIPQGRQHGKPPDASEVKRMKDEGGTLNPRSSSRAACAIIGKHSLKGRSNVYGAPTRSGEKYTDCTRAMFNVADAIDSRQEKS